MKITSSIENGVLYLLWDNPPVNSLSVEVLKQLDTMIKNADSDEKIKVLVLSGSGDKYFSAGANINEIAAARTADEMAALIKTGQAILNGIANSGKPVIANINGTCLGGGLELAMACHLRICSNSARFGLPEINLGLIPSFGGSQRLPRLVGFAKGLEMILTGRVIDADEAISIGLVNRIAAPAELPLAVRELAESIAVRNALTIRNDLRAIREGLKLTVEEGLELERKLMLEVFEQNDVNKILTDYLEKSKKRR